MAEARITANPYDIEAWTLLLKENQVNYLFITSYISCAILNVVEVGKHMYKESNIPDFVLHMCFTL